MRPLSWFRLHVDAIHDSKLRLLAFEDRWHFVAVLCMKASGLLDDSGELRERRISVELGLTLREADEVKRRLCEVRLIDNNWQPIAWDRRQYQSDTSTERVRAHRERVKRYGNVSVTPPETETETESKSKTARFARPTIGQVTEYIHEINAPVDPQAWIDHYESNGWKVGRNPMKDWQACVRTWARGQNNGGTSNRPGRNPTEDRSAAGRVRAAVVKSRAERLAAGVG